MNVDDCLEKIRNLLKAKPHPLSSIKADKQLTDTIHSNVQLLADPFYSLSTKVWWLLNGIQSWDDDRVRCAECHQPFKDKNVVSISRGYHQFCRRSCAVKSKEVQEQKTMSLIATHGPDWKKKWHEKVCGTKLRHFGDEKFNNSQQMVQTKLERSSDDPRYFQRIAEKTKLTNLERHGNSNYNNCKQIVATRLKNNDGIYESVKSQEKKKQTCLKKFGVEWALQSETCKQKAKATCKQRYSVEHCMQSDDIQKKAQQTCLEKYGCEHPAQNHDIRLKSSQRYGFQGRSFDSAPELSLFIYLTDKNIPFEYQPAIKFSYKHDDKLHFFMPDFEIDGKLVELKGDQFLKEDGTWQCPWDHSRDSLYEAKHQCAIRNNVEVWTKNDYMRFIAYVEQNYGKSYLQSFRKRTA